jgi:hypothetical protein
MYISVIYLYIEGLGVVQSLSRPLNNRIKKNSLLPRFPTPTPHLAKRSKARLLELSLSAETSEFDATRESVVAALPIARRGGTTLGYIQHKLLKVYLDLVKPCYQGFIRSP